MLYSKDELSKVMESIDTIMGYMVCDEDGCEAVFVDGSTRQMVFEELYELRNEVEKQLFVESES